MARVRGEEQPGFLEVMESWLVHQPWFPSHRGRRSLTRVGGLRLPTPAGDADPELFLELHIFDVDHVASRQERHRDRVAVPVAVRSRPSALAGKNAFIGRLSAAHGGEIWLYDGARDRAFLAAWLEMARRRQGSRNGRSRGEALAGFDQWGPFTVQLRRTASESKLRPVTRTLVTPEGVAEGAGPDQRVVVEFLRRPRVGRDAELETALALTNPQGTTISRVLGVISCAWEDRSEEVPDSTVGAWMTGDVAIIRDAAGQAPDGRGLARKALLAGRPFKKRARGLGRALGTLHADLAASFGAHPQTRDQLREASEAARRTLQSQWDRSRGEFDDDELSDMSEVVEQMLVELREAEEPMNLQRIHGELGLAHAHLAEAGQQRWIFNEDGGMVDHALPLRDVVSVLMSFATLVMETASEAPQQGKADEAEPTNFGRWYEEVSAAFLQGYQQSEADDAVVDSVFFRAAMLEEALELFARWQGRWVFAPSMLLQAES
ncbi:maltokinase N-terminal cap-like domain-containing protein [Nesterenkonia suensis]